MIFNPQLLLYFDRNNRSIFIISCLHIILRFDDSICPFMGIIINYLGRKLKKLKYIFEIVKLFRKDFIKICLQVLIHFVYVILLKSYFLFQIKSATYLVEIFNLWNCINFIWNRLEQFGTFQFCFPTVEL